MGVRRVRRIVVAMICGIDGVMVKERSLEGGNLQEEAGGMEVYAGGVFNVKKVCV